MAFGGFNKSGSSAPMAEINMVPMIDVMLVLLVIFILTAPLLTHAVKVDLPHASSQENRIEAKRIDISITPDSTIYWDGEKVAGDQLEQRMQTAAKGATDAASMPEIHLRADKTTPYEAVAKTMASAAKAGLTKIAFVSQPD